MALNDIPLIPTVYHIRKGDAKSYTPISHIYLTRKLFDAFSNLTNGIKSREMKSVYKGKFLNFELIFT